MKQFIFLLFLLTICSCYETKSIKPPENLIEPELMSEIMLDVILMKNIKRNAFAVKEKRVLLVNQYILDKYQIDSLQFIISQEYYSKNPKEYIPIFKVIQTRLGTLKDSLQKIEAEKSVD
ncbi:MAG: hypothetical protein CBC79_06940 [Gammaproteobacteria bacterium TMED119]|nr:MAG: hypothetical protein CBC79_06940 [Gammaproteobacteria bacterium TMED119]PDH45937.1 MAG: hypothetical protein CND43_01895 [Flavobacteriales bacterium MED-G15]|tara:strand:- start:1410 stop:1769 length:360 start_codon:yes stop_codon:yes gene_type:complete